MIWYLYLTGIALACAALVWADGHRMAEDPKAVKLNASSILILFLIACLWPLLVAYIVSDSEPE